MQRADYVENNPVPKKRAAKKKEDKVMQMLLGLSDVEREALIKEMGG